MLRFIGFIGSVLLALSLASCGNSDPQASAQNVVNRQISAYSTAKRNLEKLALERPEFKQVIELALADTDPQFTKFKSDAMSSNIQVMKDNAENIDALTKRLSNLNTQLNPPPAKQTSTASAKQSATATAGSGFGASTTATATTTAPSGVGATATHTGSGFGNTATATNTATSGSGFAATATHTGSGFGNTATATNTSGSGFGTTATHTGSGFGTTATATNTNTGSGFGGR